MVSKQALQDAFDVLMTQLLQVETDMKAYQAQVLAMHGKVSSALGSRFSSVVEEVAKETDALIAVSDGIIKAMRLKQKVKEHSVAVAEEAPVTEPVTEPVAEIEPEKVPAKKATKKTKK